ncbi:MAG: hypothetical protein K6E22_10150 [Treponema sp.]|nr:hypothetical protein [Treponema sp.]
MEKALPYAGISRNSKEKWRKWKFLPYFPLPVQEKIQISGQIPVVKGVKCLYTGK